MTAAGQTAGPPQVSPARVAAWRALCRLEAGRARLDDSLGGLPELESLDARDRGLANELVVGAIKRRASLDAVLGSFTRAPLETTAADVLTDLRLAAFQLLFLDRVPAHAAVSDAVQLVAERGTRTQGFVNAVLRKVAAQGRARFAELSSGGDARAWSLRHSCPPWLVRLLREELGDESGERFLCAANAAPERCLRVNTLRGGREEAETALAEADYVVRRVGALPEALIYEGPALERCAPFRAGLVTPQSRGSQLAGLVAAEGAVVAESTGFGQGAGPSGAATEGGSVPSRVLDLCAAPGTKTSQLVAALPKAHVTAVELDPARLALLRENLRRLGVVESRDLEPGADLMASDVLELPQSYDGVFDAVLLDAPCSGLGTLASRADLRWRRRAADVPRLAELQTRLLARAARCVRPGGSLTYAVCTLPRAETVDVVASLLAVEDGADAGEGARPVVWRLDDLGAAWPTLAHPEMPATLRVLPPSFGSTGFFIARLRRLS